MEGWDRYRLGHPAVEVLADAPRLNVQSGHREILNQGPSGAALGPDSEQGEDIRWSRNQPTEIPHVGTFAGHFGQRHELDSVACFCGLPPFWRAEDRGSQV